ncbi:MAG: hypothetical protein Q7R73_00345 [bacterium]|nr:hypothetical protein [bacterium]
MNHKILKIFLQVAVLVAIFAGALYATRIAQESEAVRVVVARYGYVGIFVISVISGFNLAVPVPAIAFLPLFLESGLNFWAAIFFIGAGMTLADTIAYFLGKVGRQVISYSTGDGVLLRLEKMRERHRFGPMAVLFLFAALVPFPNEILVVPLGFLKYRIVYIIPTVFAGNLVFNTLYAAGVVELFQVTAGIL